jgi:hypothetical protein
VRRSKRRDCEPFPPILTIRHADSYRRCALGGAGFGRIDLAVSILPAARDFTGQNSGPLW